MPTARDRLLRVFSWVVLLPALVTVACDEPPASRHAALGDWTLIGEGGIAFAELKFFPNGKCRFTQSGEKLLFCGWDPDGEKGVRLRFGALLPNGRASGRVEGEELIVEFGNAGSSTWVRAGSQREESVKTYLRGLALIEAGEPAKGLAEWTAAADRGDRFIQNNLAWLLATGKDAQLHDGKKAIVYAEMAVAQERSAAYLDTLAAALARDGQFEKAVQVQEEALSLLTKDPSSQPRSEEIQRFVDRLALYKAGQVYTEP
ncbi:MAG TPA: hypothetical protein VE078_03460 [Thermoanaerobaculia bacterium]|nr:hypothetical protein [Thermoanaerobaculia bacterium]